MTKKKTKEESEQELKSMNRARRLWHRTVDDPVLVQKKVKDSRRAIYRDSQRRKDT